MLSGSALLRVLLLITAVGGLIGLARHVWPVAEPEKPLATAPSVTPVRRSEPALVRTPEPAMKVAAMPQPPAKSAPAQPVPSSSPLAAIEARSLFDAQPAAPVPRAAAVPPARTTGAARQDVASADANAVPRARDLIDLNAGSLAELNGLSGGGSVGRAIIQHRPYTAVDQLLSKRVLSRATYQRVRDQVTVR